MLQETKSPCHHVSLGSIDTTRHIITSTTITEKIIHALYYQPKNPRFLRCGLILTSETVLGHAHIPTPSHRMHASIASHLAQRNSNMLYWTVRTATRPANHSLRALFCIAAWSRECIPAALNGLGKGCRCRLRREEGWRRCIVLRIIIIIPPASGGLNPPPQAHHPYYHHHISHLARQCKSATCHERLALASTRNISSAKRPRWEEAPESVLYVKVYLIAGDRIGRSRFLAAAA